MVVFTTFIVGLLFLDKTRPKNNLLLGVLLNYTATEFICIFLNMNDYSVGLLYNISIIIQFVLWLLILSIVFDKGKTRYVLLFLMLALFSLLDKFIDFNSNNFIIGSFIYLIIYIYENIKLVKNEDLSFFQTNDYLLINLPVVFFLGRSFLFAFDSHALSTATIIGGLTLHNGITYFVNAVYYILINIYIYKERKR